MNTRRILLSKVYKLLPRWPVYVSSLWRATTTQSDILIQYFGYYESKLWSRGIVVWTSKPQDLCKFNYSLSIRMFGRGRTPLAKSDENCTSQLQSLAKASNVLEMWSLETTNDKFAIRQPSAFSRVNTPT